MKRNYKLVSTRERLINSNDLCGKILNLNLSMLYLQICIA